MLSGRSQTEKDKHCIISHVESEKKSQVEKRFPGAEGREEVGKRVQILSYKVNKV